MRQNEKNRHKNRPCKRAFRKKPRIYKYSVRVNGVNCARHDVFELFQAAKYSKNLSPVAQR